ncbi:Bcr/CflA family efflux MFS transporter [Facilibium subflavum]|uniref:Bcr/CflA family efflux MFS transporter n=1 Tax=Facilibium subflavum TaxID=2219058 RepID=UPI000E649A26|nr:Bcr/CflA family efflux MFS transporter [Facilibium subflavum]
MLTLKVSKPAKVIFIIIILFTSMLGIFISDIYVPSLPSITHEFHTNPSVLAFSVTFYFIIFAFAQLIYGPLSERYGRRVIFLSGLAISIIGTLITLLSTSFTELMIGRALEAIGMAAPMSLGRVILRDVIPDKKDYARFMSFLGIGTLLAPVLAPIIGAILAHLYHWRADFIFILILSISCYVLAQFFLVETLLTPKKRLSAKLSVKTYLWVIKNKHFIKHMLISSLMMSTIISYFSLSAFLFQVHFGLNPLDYAAIFAIGEAFIMLGMFANGIALKYIAIETAQKIAVGLFLFSSIILLIQALFFSHNLTLIMIAIIIFNLSAGIIFPTSSTLAIVTFKARLGAVGGLYGCISMLIAALISAIVVIIPISANILLAFLLLACATIASLLTLLIPESALTDH